MATKFSKRAVLSVEGLESRQLLSANPVSLFTTPMPALMTQPISIVTTAQIKIIVPQVVMTTTPPNSAGPTTGVTTGTMGASGPVLLTGGSVTRGVPAVGPQQGGILAQLTPLQQAQHAVDDAQDKVNDANTDAAAAKNAAGAPGAILTPEQKATLATALTTATNSITAAAAASSAAANKINLAAANLVANFAKTDLSVTSSGVTSLWNNLQAAQAQFDKLRADAKAARAAANALGTPEAKKMADAADNAVRDTGYDICNACTSVQTAVKDVGNTQIADAAKAMHDLVINQSRDLLHSNYGN